MIYTTARKINLSESVSIQTPLFIPSFSSKGFRFQEFKGKLISETDEIVKYFTPFIFESVLISAYDVYHNFVSSTPTLLNSVDLLFIDSGGYEASALEDLSEVTKKINLPLDWNSQLHNEVIGDLSLSEYTNVVLVNFDDPSLQVSFKKQVRLATEFFSKNPKAIKDFLIKPSNNNGIVSIDEICNDIDLLNNFDIIGLTEKELGVSLEERIKNIVKLVKMMRENSIEKPIHLFGSLDPLTSSLFFLAGVEIFDGLVWLKMAYNKGFTIYTQNSIGLGDFSSNLKDNELQKVIAKNNLSELENLKAQLIEVAYSKSFEPFSYIGDGNYAIRIEKIFSEILNI